MAAHVLLVSLAVACVLSNQVVLGANIRGVNPSKKAFFKSGKDFTCLDGSATIPFSYVNDDYCDCRSVHVLLIHSDSVLL